MTQSQIAGVALAAPTAASLCACGEAGASRSGVDAGTISDAVKADMAQMVADYNNHDAARVASHDALDVVQMVHGAANNVGPAADFAANQKSFADDPTQHVTDSVGVVDVAASGDTAVYRATYLFTGLDPKTRKPMTENGNYLAGYKLQPDGAWKMAWSVVSDTGSASSSASAPGSPATTLDAPAIAASPVVESRRGGEVRPQAPTSHERMGGRR